MGCYCNVLITDYVLDWFYIFACVWIGFVLVLVVFACVVWVGLPVLAVLVFCGCLRFIGL